MTRKNDYSLSDNHSLIGDKITTHNQQDINQTPTDKQNREFDRDRQTVLTLTSRTNIKYIAVRDYHIKNGVQQRKWGC